MEGTSHSKNNNILELLIYYSIGFKRKCKRGFSNEFDSRKRVKLSGLCQKQGLEYPETPKPSHLSHKLFVTINLRTKLSCHQFFHELTFV